MFLFLFFLYRLKFLPHFCYRRFLFCPVSSSDLGSMQTYYPGPKCLSPSPTAISIRNIGNFYHVFISPSLPISSSQNITQFKKIAISSDERLNVPLARWLMVLHMLQVMIDVGFGEAASSSSALTFFGQIKNGEQQKLDGRHGTT